MDGHISTDLARVNYIKNFLVIIVDNFSLFGLKITPKNFKNQNKLLKNNPK